MQGNASGRENMMLISCKALQFNRADEENRASDKRGREIREKGAFMAGIKF